MRHIYRMSHNILELNNQIRIELGIFRRPSRGRIRHARGHQRKTLQPGTSSK